MSDVPPQEIIIEIHLPFELVENILSRLPVKTLKRFRAVDKSWCRLIDSEEFAKKYLCTEKITIATKNLCLIMGLRCKTLIEIQKTGVKIEFYRDTDLNWDSPNSIVELKGTLEQIANASKIIHDKLSESQSRRQTNKSRQGPPMQKSGCGFVPQNQTTQGGGYE